MVINTANIYETGKGGYYFVASKNDILWYNDFYNRKLNKFPRSIMI
jgi:hypothetical protein